MDFIKSKKSESNLIEKIHSIIEGLQNGNMKECPRCKKIRPLDDFRDDSLITDYGRFCKFCKGLAYENIKDNDSKIESYANQKAREYNLKSGTETPVKICPLCGSKMVLRTGKYGKFYGCPRYPYCKGTRRY